MMQENSYFALHLPHGWWLFGLDLALVDDIDMCQCRYPHKGEVTYELRFVDDELKQLPCLGRLAFQ
jgi:hypothetical protein